MKPKLYLKAIHHLPWLLLATACGTSQERSVTSYSETDVNLELINDDHAELNIADNPEPYFPYNPEPAYNPEPVYNPEPTYNPEPVGEPIYNEEAPIVADNEPTDDSPPNAEETPDQLEEIENDLEESNWQDVEVASEEPDTSPVDPDYNEDVPIIGDGTEAIESIETKLSASELANVCKKLKEENINVVEIADASGNVRSYLGAYDILVFKITGNMSKLNLKIDGSEERALKGVCFFLTGNQSQLDFELDVDLDAMYYWSRGNQAVANITVNDNASFDDIMIDMNGNSGDLTIDGAGSYSCDNALTRGNKQSITCEN